MRIDLLNNSAQALGQMNYATNEASNNINNSANGYYTRQAVVFTTNSAGVLTASPIRMSNAFLNQQLHSSTADLASSNVVYSMASNVDVLVTGISADSNGGSSNALQQALSSINESLVNLAADDSEAARTTMLSRLESFFFTSDTMLNELDGYKSKLTDDVDLLVKKVNETSAELTKINEQIRKKSKNNDALLTQRDQLIGDLSQYVKLSVEENDNGTVIVRIAGGQELVNGNISTDLSSKVNQDGSTSVYLHGVDLSKSPERLGGALGGSLKAYSDVVSSSESELSALVVGFAGALNAANMSGYKEDGTLGGEIVDIPSVLGVGNLTNSGTGQLNVSLNYDDVASLTSGPYEMTVTSAGYDFLDVSTGKSVVVPSLPADVFGLTIDGNGTFDLGDKFNFNPMPEMAKGIAVTDTPEDIAAAANTPVTSGDNQNLLNLSNVLSDKVLGGSTVVDSLGDLFSNIGNMTNSAENANKTAVSINASSRDEWSNYSAVSTQEEELNILKYQQVYNSVSKVIQTSKQMFDTLFNSI